MSVALFNIALIKPAYVREWALLAYRISDARQQDHLERVRGLRRLWLPVKEF
jgi:hypothetical protein